MILHNNALLHEAVVLFLPSQIEDASTQLFCYRELEVVLFFPSQIEDGSTKHMSCYRELEGNHHLHINTPEVILPVIRDFIQGQCSTFFQHVFTILK